MDTSVLLEQTIYWISGREKNEAKQIAGGCFFAAFFLLFFEMGCPWKEKNPTEQVAGGKKKVHIQ